MITVPSWQTAVQGSVESGAHTVSRDCAGLARWRRASVVSALSSRGVVNNDMTRMCTSLEDSTGVLSTGDVRAANPTVGGVRNERAGRNDPRAVSPHTKVTA